MRVAAIAIANVFFMFFPPLLSVCISLFRPGGLQRACQLWKERSSVLIFKKNIGSCAHPERNARNCGAHFLYGFTEIRRVDRPDLLRVIYDESSINLGKGISFLTGRGRE
jgi:hypothetical protein